MNLVTLQESLRKELRKRIDAGELTGMELARRTAFTQAHISNFLNRKRGLKLTALDRMLKAIGLSLYDLLDPHELVRFAAVPASDEEEYAAVPLVESSVAASSEVIVNEEVKELVRMRRSFLNRLRADLAAPARRSWTRFVLIKADAREGMSMWPRLNPGALLLLDRHYTTLRPYHKSDGNIYAVRKGETCTVKHVELSGLFVVLRPHNMDSPVEVLPIQEGQALANLIVGRVAHISAEA